MNRLNASKLLPATAEYRHSHKKSGGFSLIEVAVILLFVSLAMIPIVANISGPGGQYGTGNARVSGSGTTIIGSKHKEITLANALMERLLSGDMSILNTPIGSGSCSGGSLPTVNSGTTRTFNCVSTQYNQQFYYQWIVTDRASEFPGNQNSGTNTMGNDFYRATLNIFNNDSWSGTPILTMPSIAFRNTQSPTQPGNTTGIVIVLDTSGSMDEGAENTGDLGMRLPYRYTDTGYNPGSIGSVNGTALDINNNANLDLVLAANSNDASTPYDDRYPLNGVLGITNCGKSADPIFGAYGTFIYFPPFFPASHWENLCNRQTISNFQIDQNLSRLEAARSSLLRFLLTIENDPALRNNIRLGFMVFNSNTQLQIPNTINGTLIAADSNGRYPTIRRRMSWLNRTGNALLQYDEGGTGTWDAVYQASTMLLNSANSNLNGRAIFLVTDGLPTASNCSGNADPPIAQTVTTGVCMRDRTFSSVNGLGRSLGNGTFPGANGKTIAVYGLGLMYDEAKIRNVIEQGFTIPTRGDFQYASSVGDMSAVFDNMKYAILKEIIQANGSRYGIKYN